MQKRPHTKFGFTLIELLIVVVIIGILVAIAIPKFTNTKSKAYAAAQKADLKNLTTAQETYFDSHSGYSTVLADLNFKSSGGVIVAVTAATPTGWSATATHPSADPLVCAVFYGSAAPVAPAVANGVVACQ